MFRILSVLLLSIAVSACAITPREGPTSGEIKQQSNEQDYVIVDVNAEVVDSLSAFQPVGLSKQFSNSRRRHTVSTVGVGDVLTVTVHEADRGGLFSSDNGKSASFPSVEVDANGDISIPYAGLIKVKGKTPLQIQDLIVENLEGKAIQPQAMVMVKQNESNVATLSGDVAKPGIYPVTSENLRLMDLVALAGGTRYPARETYVTLMRGKQQGIQMMKTIIEQPAENIYVSRGDRIYVSHEPQRFTVLGAVKLPSIYPFETSTISVLEAIAAAGGLIDERADATGVFVFRYEDPKVLDTLGMPYSRTVRGQVPTIYRINMKHAQSYFYAQSFHLRDKDSVFVTNAKAVEISKILQLIGMATSSVGNVTGTVKAFN
ncbi:polysaccharide biosynthesis/export family protein [uncultured Cohaesibacter sp.]|uniref:polysaccharide biosynthesis/export family protein n=1 Tax=uncultured Cohaesibacter sp. TaxID=1002546 RepID=UPI0029C740DC|nr:polysaccharide biosynthesis/export family protein [uncultured Cohaesibacter sp.]